MWFDLKAPEGGRIHCLLDLKKPVSVEELDQEKEKKKIFQVSLSLTLSALRFSLTQRSQIAPVKHITVVFGDQTMFVHKILKKVFEDGVRLIVWGSRGASQEL